MVSRRFVMNRRLFRIQSCLSATPFLLLRLVKRKVWPLTCSHALSQPWLCSRGDLPIAFRGTVIFSTTFSSLTASRSPWWQSSLVLLSPFVPMMQSTLSNNSAQVSLTAAPRRSVAPLGTSSTSCKRLPHRLCVAVKFGVCVCECGKVTALRHLPTTALPSVPRCRDFNRFFIASMVFRTAPSGTCTTLCLLSASPFVLFRLSF